MEPYKNLRIYYPTTRMELEKLPLYYGNMNLDARRDIRVYECTDYVRHTAENTADPLDLGI